MTSYSIADVLKICSNHIPQLLIATESMAANCAAASVLPLNLSNAIGFEIRLGPGGNEAGFALNAQFPSFGWNLLAGVQAGLEPAWFSTSAWSGIRAVCRQVADPTSDGYGQVGNLWLEFDVDRPGQLTPDAFLGIALPPPGRPRVALRTWAELARGDQLPDELWFVVERCMAGVPDHTLPDQLGIMLARPLQAVRLVISFTQLSSVFTYLDSINWSGPNLEYAANKAIAALDWLNGLADRYTLQIDIIPGSILPRVGIEARFLDPADRAHLPRWTKLLETLTAQGLCTPEKCAALLGYPGASREFLGVPMVVLRGLSHVKLVLEPDQLARAKGYFGALLLWEGLKTQ